MKKIFLIIGLAGTVSLAGALPAAALDGVVVIVNNSVPVNSISAAALKDIYTGRTMYWQDGQRVGLAVLADESGGKTDAALEEVSGMDASHFKTFWQRMVFSGRGSQPGTADDAAALVARVASTRGTIALVPADAKLNGVKTLEVR
jgi:ABC-type phosphate transport system substrate-binding protein